MTRFDLSLLGIAALLVVFVVAKTTIFNHPKTETSYSDIGLSDLIRKLSDELRRNQEDLLKRDDAALFQLSEAEVEVSFVLKQATSVSGQVSTTAVAIKAGEDYGKDVTNRLKVKLSPFKAKTGETPPEETEKK